MAAAQITRRHAEERERQESSDRLATGTGWSGREEAIGLLLRLILGGLFIYSGGAKLLDPAAFHGEIANFELLSWKTSSLVAVYLPWLEVACGIALVTKWQMTGSIAILCSLMVGFIGFVASAWIRNLDVSCGCFGASDAATSYPLWIGRNLLILAGLGALPLLEIRRRRRSGAGGSKH